MNLKIKLKLLCIVFLNLRTLLLCKCAPPRSRGTTSLAIGGHCHIDSGVTYDKILWLIPVSLHLSCLVKPLDGDDSLWLERQLDRQTDHNLIELQNSPIIFEGTTSCCKVYWFVLAIKLIQILIVYAVLRNYTLAVVSKFSIFRWISMCFCKVMLY